MARRNRGNWISYNRSIYNIDKALFIDFQDYGNSAKIIFSFAEDRKALELNYYVHPTDPNDPDYEYNKHLPSKDEYYKTVKRIKRMTVDEKGDKIDEILDKGD